MKHKKSSLDLLSNGYNRVRQEMTDVGLMDDGLYLDEIQVYQTHTLTGKLMGADGWVFDSQARVGFVLKLLDFDNGDIYVPARVALQGMPFLLAVIRHEYAHAWAWLDPDFFEQTWFRNAFGGEYYDEPSVYGEVIYNNLDAFESGFQSLGLAYDFASAYAATQPKEDFAETFALYITRKGKIASLKKRPGLYKKLLAVERAIRRKSRQLGLC